MSKATRIVTQKQTLLLSGSVFGLALASVLWYQALGGIGSNEVFHIAGLYDTLRGAVLLPDISNWNFRPVFYRTVMALLSIVPINLARWTPAFDFLFPLVSAVLVGGTLLFVTARRNTTWTTTCSQGIVLAGLLLGSRHTAFSADAFAGYLMYCSAWVVLEERVQSERARLGFATFLVLGLFLLKGITVLLALPVFALAWSRWGFRGAFLAFAGGACLSAAFLILFWPDELVMLAEAGRMQLAGRSKVVALPYVPSSPVAPPLWGVFVSGCCVLALSCFHGASRRSTAIAVGLVFGISGYGVYLLQAKPWHYHVAPLYSVLALGACWRIRVDSVRRGIPLLVASLGLCLAAGIALSDHKAQQNVKLAAIQGLTPTDPVLYLSFGTRGFGRYGYPAACGYFSAHPVNRFSARQLAQDSLARSSKRFVDCALAYDGKAVVWDRKWAGLKRRGHLALERHVRANFRPLPSNSEVWIHK